MKKVWLVSCIMFSLIVCAGILLNPAPAAAQSEWVQLPGNQPVPRTGHSIVRIGNGAYIYGGNNGTTVFEDLWKYNYETGWEHITFTVTAPTLIPRYGHTATAYDDKIFIISGRDDSTVFPYLSGQLTDIYDPVTNTLSRAPSGVSFPGGGIYASATPLDGEIWLYGGRMGNDVLGDLWSYNPASGSWSGISYYPFRPLFGHVAVPYEGKIYVFGGHDGEEAKGDLRCFDPTTRTWTTIATFDSPEALYLSAMGYLEDDPNAQRNLMGAQAGGRMWLVGGKNSNDEDVADVWEFNFVTNRWRELTPLPEPRANAGLAVFPNPDGTVTLLVFGGERDGVPTAETMAMTVTLPPTYTVNLPLVMQ